MKRIETGGGGECLFSSLGFFLNKSGKEVRREIVDKIKKDCSRMIIAGMKICCLIRISESIKVEEYCLRMAISTTSGGEIELYTASILYDVKIEVYEKEIILKYIYPNLESTNRIIRLFYTGGHYQALV